MRQSRKEAILCGKASCGTAATKEWCINAFSCIKEKLFLHFFIAAKPHETISLRLCRKIRTEKEAF